MLPKGYLTKTSYDSKTNKEIKLKYLKYEIRNAIRDEVISYVPSYNCNLKECANLRISLNDSYTMEHIKISASLMEFLISSFGYFNLIFLLVLDSYVTSYG